MPSYTAAALARRHGGLAPVSYRAPRRPREDIAAEDLRERAHLVAQDAAFQHAMREWTAARECDSPAGVATATPKESQMANQYSKKRTIKRATSRAASARPMRRTKAPARSARSRVAKKR